MIRVMLISIGIGVCLVAVRSTVFATQCGGDAVHETAVDAGKQAAVDAGNRICPVSGERVGTTGMEPATYVHEGKSYNFCCGSCIEAFKKDPQKYIQKVEDELKKETLAPNPMIK